MVVIMEDLPKPAKPFLDRSNAKHSPLQGSMIFGYYAGVEGSEMASLFRGSLDLENPRLSISVPAIAQAS
jgi:hypothetical protein